MDRLNEKQMGNARNLQDLDLRAGWRFAPGECPEARLPEFDDGQWEEVFLPHTWNSEDMRPGTPEAEAYVGPAWYRRRLSLPRDRDAESRVLLVFEAVANYSDVWVDGKYVGGRDGGFLSFRLDVTPALARGGEHLIAVRANNAPRPGSAPPDPIDWERFGGIYRPARIQIRPACHIGHKGIRIRTPRVTPRSAEVEITARVRCCRPAGNQLLMVHKILDPEGREVARSESRLVPKRLGIHRTACVNLEVRDPRLWSPDSPALYHVETELSSGGRLLDRETNPLGFRWFSFDPDRGFSLNGRGMKLCGVNLHQEFIGLGNACPTRVFDGDLRLIKDAGINFIRTSHYPRHEYVLELCDRMGVMVMEEQPFWHGSVRARDGEPAVDNARRLMREMVEHHGNHPCIIAWNTVNEIMLTPVRGERHPDPRERQKRHWLQEDEWPYALRAVAAMNDELHLADPDRPTSVVVGGRWEANDLAGVSRLGDIVAYNGGAVHDLEQGRPAYDVARDRDPGRVSMMSEGVLNDRCCLRGDWEGELEIWECYAEHWSRFYRREWFCGGAMWVFADYSAKGTYRTRGMVDAFRLPYQSYYFFQSQWNPEPMAHICCHWDWPGSEGQPRRVIVFTNCPEAELFLDGRSMGAARPGRERWPHLPHPPMEWSVEYRPGEIEVVAASGDAIVRDRRVTPSDPARVELRLEQDLLLADGRDVALVTAAILDREGNLCSRAEHDLHLEISGPASLAGQARLPAAGGLARFAVRSDGREGEVAVSAAGEGLAPANLKIPARAAGRSGRGNGGNPSRDTSLLDILEELISGRA